MDESEPSLDELAGAILDGTSVDWPAVQSNASETERTVVEALYGLSTLVDFHRRQRAESDWPLQTWGHIRVLEAIGNGAFGRVYRGWDTRLDRQVALKVLRAPSDPEGVRTTCIIEEGRLLARVRHPNVVTIYGAERIGETVGLWMELIDGETVEERLAKGRPFQPSEVLEIGSQICQAVSAVHGTGLLHRDIKPQNVMLATDRRAVLMDFGTGWDMTEASASTCAVAGTPLYLAPELLRGGEASIQSDIYSIGVLLYHMLTGAYPVCADNLADLRLAHERRDRLVPREFPRHVPRRLARIIERAIDPDAQRRYQSADALALALDALRLRGTARPLKRAIALTAGLMLGALVLWRGASWLRHGVAPDRGALRPTSEASTPFEGPTIAVLPLKNLNTEPGSDQFVDGFTTEIINSLATNEHLQVRSPTSSFASSEKSSDLQHVASQLNVSMVVEGSMRHSGEHVQVVARLVRAQDGLTVWKQSFESNIRDLVAVRDRIVSGVVSSLRLTPVPARHAYQIEPEAYGRYLAARALVGRRGVPAAKTAVEHLEQAIASDPTFAPAYAALADAYAYMSLPTYQGMRVNQAQALMRTAALNALQLDPDLAEAHAAMGLVHARDLDWQASQAEFDRAIALNPSLSQVYTSYSFFTLRPLRKFDDAERLLNVALQSDPLSLDVWREMAEVYFTIGRYGEAIDLLQRVRVVDSRLTDASVVLARALACDGRPDEALALYDEIDHAATGVPQYRAYAYVRSGRRSDAERLAKANDTYPYRATLIYAALGDVDRAFEALARTTEQEPQRIPLLLTWPEMAPLRTDPRFSAVRKRFGLP